MLASAAWAQSPTPAASSKPAEKKAGASSAGQPQTDEEKTLYALGLSIGRSLSVFSLTPEQLEFVRAGLYAQVKGEKPTVNIEEYGPKIQALAMARQSASAKEYLAKAAKEKGAVKTASGLIYQELKAGSGASPTATDSVTVNYRGTLIDGREFDSSYKRGEPASFPLSGVIPCWTEGVQKMKVGGKARLVCPSALAYGDQGSPPNIPGGATLVFEVELVGINGKQ